MSRRVALLMLSMLPCAVACTENTLESPPNSGNLSETQDTYLMPVAEPKFNSLLLADQAAYKPQPAPQDVPAIELNLPQAVTAAASEPSEPDSESADEEAASQPESEAASQPSTQAAASAPVAELHDSARPPAEQLPPNPGGMKADEIRTLARAAIANASDGIKAALLEVKLGDGTKLADAVGGAEGLAEISFKNVRIVENKWLDAATLEVAIEVSVGDVIESLKENFRELDTSPLVSLGLDKVYAATGVAKAP